MSQTSIFTLHRLLRHEKTILPLGISCPDWQSAREEFRRRGRSKNEQLIVMLNGLIYAIERADGDGFAMIYQDQQSLEDQHWYPDWDIKVQSFRDDRHLGEDEARIDPAT